MYQNEYEVVFITSAELSEDQYKAVLDKVSATIIKYKGSVLVHESWGRRKFAYPIRKKNYGMYTLIDFVGPADLPKELTRLARLDDNFMRLVTVKIEDRVDVDLVKEVAEKRSIQRLERLNPNV
jgi:small subunit ribosomal protein S6